MYSSAGLCNIGFEAFDQFLHRRQVAHGAEYILFLAYRVNDVINALLNNDRIRTVGRHFMGESVAAGQTIGFVSQTVILTENAGAAGSSKEDL